MLLRSNDIISTSILLDVAPAMLAHPGARPKLNRSFDMFILSRKKRCSVCGDKKKFSEFYKDANSPDGYGRRCKSCCKTYSSQYYQDNKDELQNYARDWNSTNSARVRENVDNWRAANPGKASEHTNNRRARVKGNGGVITTQEWRELKAKYNYTCLRCKRREPEIKLTLDHVKPIFMGGKNVIENAQPLCLSCNSSKGKKIIDYRPLDSQIED